MVVAALGAASIGYWSEGAILLFLFSLGNALQHYAMGRTYRAVRALMELSPEDALVVRAGHEERLPVEDLVVGDLVLVKPGERIAADGEIERGESAIDQAPITGESMPVRRGRASRCSPGHQRARRLADPRHAPGAREHAGQDHRHRRAGAG